MQTCYASRLAAGRAADCLITVYAASLLRDFGNRMEKNMNLASSRILCIDDDTNTSDWIKATLDAAHLPASVRAAKSAREAFKLLNEEDFDLCILEYALVDGTGPQLCSLVRRMGWEVPIMFFTALNRDIDRQNAISAGADDYLCKPEDLSKFVTAAARLLRKSRSGDRYQPLSYRALRAA